MARRIIEHADWTGGEFGRLEPWRARANQFTGTNMLVYRTGELGVRPGLKDVTPTAGGGFNVAGQIFMFNRHSSSGTGLGTSVLFGINDDLYAFNPSQTIRTTATIGTLSAAPSSLCDTVWYGRRLYIITPNSGAYQVDADTLTALTNSPNGNSIALLGDRLVIAQTGASSHILRYNGLTAGVSDFTVWTATNTIPVGDAASIFKLMNQRSHLVISKQHTGHWVLTGNPGVNEALRQAVTNVQGPEAYQGLGRAQNGLIWFADVSGRSGHPMSFDGTQMVAYDHLNVTQISSGLGTFTESNAAIPFSSDDDTGLLLHTQTPTSGTADHKDLFLSDNVWSQHNFPVQLHIAQGVALPYQYYQNPANPVTGQLRSTDTFVFTDGGSQLVAPKFYAWSPRLDRPGSETVNDNTCPERAGDVSSAQVAGNWTSAEIHLPDADEFMVQGVIVDFRSWNTGGSLTNHFDLEIECLRRYDNTSPNTSLKGSWDEVGALSSTAGTLKREVFMFGEQGLGNGYQLKFTNVRGIAFQRIQVILDTTNFRGI